MEKFPQSTHSPESENTPNTTWRGGRLARRMRNVAILGLGLLGASPLAEAQTHQNIQEDPYANTEGTPDKETLSRDTEKRWENLLPLLPDYFSVLDLTFLESTDKDNLYWTIQQNNKVPEILLDENYVRFCFSMQKNLLNSFYSKDQTIPGGSFLMSIIHPQTGEIPDFTEPIPEENIKLIVKILSKTNQRRTLTVNRFLAENETEYLQDIEKLERILESLENGVKFSFSANLQGMFEELEESTPESLKLASEYRDLGMDFLPLSHFNRNPEKLGYEHVQKNLLEINALITPHGISLRKHIFESILSDTEQFTTEGEGYIQVLELYLKHSKNPFQGIADYLVAVEHISNSEYHTFIKDSKFINIAERMINNNIKAGLNPFNKVNSFWFSVARNKEARDNLRSLDFQNYWTNPNWAETERGRITEATYKATFKPSNKDSTTQANTRRNFFNEGNFIETQVDTAALQAFKRILDQNLLDRDLYENEDEYTEDARIIGKKLSESGLEINKQSVESLYNQMQEQIHNPELLQTELYKGRFVIIVANDELHTDSTSYRFGRDELIQGIKNQEADSVIVLRNGDDNSLLPKELKAIAEGTDAPLAIHFDGHGGREAAYYSNTDPNGKVLYSELADILYYHQRDNTNDIAPIVIGDECFGSDFAINVLNKYEENRDYYEGLLSKRAAKRLDTKNPIIIPTSSLGYFGFTEGGDSLKTGNYSFDRLFDEGEVITIGKILDIERNSPENTWNNFSVFTSSIKDGKENWLQIANTFEGEKELMNDLTIEMDESPLINIPENSSPEKYFTAALYLHNTKSLSPRSSLFIASLIGAEKRIEQCQEKFKEIMTTEKIS